MHNLQAFTLNSVPPSESEIVAGGIGRNFISRDLLEAKSIDDALCVRPSNLSSLSSYVLSSVGGFNSMDCTCRELNQQKFLQDIVTI